MQNKSKKTDEKNDSRNPYKINKAAVDRLVNADKKTYPKTNVDPGKKYRSKGFIDKIPDWIKALFIKFWFNGAVCFFIFWGLGMLIFGLDMIVVMGVVLGMVNDLLVNNVFHFFAITPGSNNKWMMFPKRKLWTFFANIVYSTIILFIVVWIYSIINIAYNAIMGTTNQIGLGVEPVFFGLLYMAVDMLFVGMKNLFIRIVTDAKEKANVK
jgi:hypothetical protein